MLFRPVRTTCGHVFCKYCLLTWVETNYNNSRYSLDDDDDVGWKWECPLCRTNIDNSLGGIDQRLEDQLIAKYGSSAYNDRHHDIVKEKVERLVVRRVEERVEDARYRLLQAEIDAVETPVMLPAGLMVGLVVSGPIGALGSALALGGHYCFRWGRQELDRIRGEERFRFGVLEDDAPIHLPEAVKVTNMSMTSVRVHLKAIQEERALKLIATANVEPQREAIIPIEVDAEDAESAVLMEVVRPIALIEKELATMVVRAGRSYLFCCTDASVRLLGAMQPAEYRLPNAEGDCRDVAPVRVVNQDSKSVRLCFYSQSDGICWFPCAEVSLKPGDYEDVHPQLEADIFKVVIWIEGEEGREEELQSVEMHRAQAYAVKDARARVDLPEAGPGSNPFDFWTQWADDLFDDSDDEDFVGGRRQRGGRRDRGGGFLDFFQRG